MAKQQVDIVVAAKDRASGAMRSMMRTAIGMGAAFLGWRAIKGAVSSVTQAYDIQQQAETKLQTALEATGGACSYSFDQLKQYAAGLQMVTTYGDETTLEMMSLLATFKNVQGPVFAESTQLILDMSTAMGQDLKSTAIQVGKALNDPMKGLTALGRVGVTFTAQQKAQIEQFVKQNDLASAQKIILQELASEFGGQAAAAAQTFGGQMKSLANDFGDAKEQIGAMITRIPGMGTGITWLRTVFRNFGLSMDIVWTSTALGLVKFWEELKFHFTDRIPNVLIWFGENWKNIFTTLWSFTSNLFTNMFDNVKNFFTAAWSWLKGDGFDFKWTGLLEGFESTLTELPDLVRKNKSAVEEALEKELGDLKGQFQQKFNEVASPTLNMPEMTGAGGGQQTPDLAAAAKNAKGVAAVEARFLTGSGRTQDYQKETAQHGRRQVALLERLVSKIENITKPRDPAPSQVAVSRFR